MTPTELKKLNGYKADKKKMLSSPPAPMLPEDDLSAEINWVIKGGVTKVKDQG